MSPHGGVAVGVAVGVLVGVAVGELVGVAVGVDVGVAVGVFVGVAVGVFVGVAVGVLVGVAVGVAVGVGVGVAVGVDVGVAVGVFVGVGVGPPVAIRQRENSDVLFAGSVAVAVTTWPSGTITGRTTFMAALLPTVVTEVAPRKVWPSPWRRGSQARFEKNSTRNVALVLFSVP